MRLGFFDHQELRERHAAFQGRRDAARVELARAIADTHRAVESSWATLSRSKRTVDEADAFARQREIVALADDLFAHQRSMIQTGDDGTILATIFPPRRTR